MEQSEFQIKVIEGISEVRADQKKMQSEIEHLGKQNSQLFEFHNANQKNIDSIPYLADRVKDHENGHSKFRVGAGLTLLGLLAKAIWDVFIRPTNHG